MVKYTLKVPSKCAKWIKEVYGYDSNHKVVPYGALNEALKGSMVGFMDAIERYGEAMLPEVKCQRCAKIKVEVDDELVGMVKHLSKVLGIKEDYLVSMFVFDLWLVAGGEMDV
jgi:hypothetical protein